MHVPYWFMHFGLDCLIRDFGCAKIAIAFVFAYYFSEIASPFFFFPIVCVYLYVYFGLAWLNWALILLFLASQVRGKLL